MMGEQPSNQNTLFYEFCLENYLSQNHLLRRIDPFLNLSALRESLSPFYNHTLQSRCAICHSMGTGAGSE